jgi:hypothetical protein
MIRKGDWTVTSFIGILVVACALAGSCHAATYESMVSYEDLLRSQTVLIGSFENLLKNSTLDGSDQYKFLDSFDDLADREQQGLASFEDLVSYNWSTLSVEEKINLTQSFEDLIRREATVLSSNEDLLKRGYCNVSPSEKQELLDRFEARLKYEVVLYTKFEDWLNFQQMIEDDPELTETWIGFLDSYEDLIRRQADLLASFEVLLKIRCDTDYLSLTKSNETIAGVTTYTYIVTQGEGVTLQNVTITDSILGLVAYDINLNETNPSNTTTTEGYALECADCNNCTCKVCNFATACGEVVTDNGNFTVCVVSNQVCVTVDDFSSPAPELEDIHPGIDIDESAMQDGEGIKEKDERNVGPAKNAGQKASSCPTCSKNK